MKVSLPGQLEHLRLQLAKCWTSGEMSADQITSDVETMMIMRMRIDMDEGPICQVTMRGFIRE